jgi:hypothetical protein
MLKGSLTPKGYGSVMELRLPDWPRWTLQAVLALMVAGFAARALASLCGIWIDEAWSIYHASEVMPVIGVFASINHDNNHHLNSLWLQLVGMGAPSWLMRLPAVLAGTGAIWLAAVFGGRRSPAAAVAAAALFAFAPMMVLYSSEARGYAYFIFFFMAALLVVDRWLADPDSPAPTGMLSIFAALGMLGHLLMATGLAVLGLWAAAVRIREKGLRPGLAEAINAFVPAAIAALTVLVIVFGTAFAASGGIRVGGYQAFSWTLFSDALIELSGLVTGLAQFGSVNPWSLFAACLCFAALIALARTNARDQLLFAIALFFLPLATMIAQPGNTGFSRYFLVVAMGLLLFAAIAIGQIWSGRQRVAKLGAIAMLTAWAGGTAGFATDFARFDRGQTDAIIPAMHARAPQGGQVTINGMHDLATLSTLAQQARYKLRIARDACTGSQFLFGTRRAGEAPLHTIEACNVRWSLITYGTALPPAGESWSLYAPEGLPSGRPVDRGPAPKQP